LEVARQHRLPDGRRVADYQDQEGIHRTRGVGAVERKASAVLWRAGDRLLTDFDAVKNNYPRQLSRSGTDTRLPARWRLATRQTVLTLRVRFARRAFLWAEDVSDVEIVSAIPGIGGEQRACLLRQPAASPRP